MTAVPPTVAAEENPFLASMLMAAYVVYGFDSAAELSEETNDPRRTAPRAITRCMLVSAVGAA
jgi:amino acid transporter